MKKISYTLQNDGLTIKSWTMPPLEDQFILEVENEYDIIPGLTKIINGVVIQPSKDVLELEEMKMSFRSMRENECFPYINR